MFYVYPPLSKIKLKGRVLQFVVIGAHLGVLECVEIHEGRKDFPTKNKGSEAGFGPVK